MVTNIPKELQCLKQWVGADQNKVPINPATSAPADPTNKNTWASFEDAVGLGRKYVGFVLSLEDGYTIIDLDDKPDNPATEQQKERYSKIIEASDSYTEVSASGRGIHIIVKGTIPRGVRRDGVEIYSADRYMICTGNVINDKPIQERQSLLDTLYSSMRDTQGSDSELIDRDQTLSDQQILDMAMRASNGDKFLKLCQGAWKDMEEYESQSEADLALLTMLAFYSRSNAQVRRLFRYSELGKREKATRDNYLNTGLRKIRAAQPPLVDMEALRTVPEKQSVTASEVAEEQHLSATQTGYELEYPPGLVGEIAQFIYSSAPRPVKTIAIGAAIGLVAGVVGRSYNISGTGLNQYIIQLATTGKGKEGASNGIDSLISAARMSCPMCDQFVGPGAFASGQALIKALDERPCFVSVLGEFGLTLQQICSPTAHSTEIMLRKVLLDLYSKSGWNKTLRSTVYSDTERNTRIVQAPNVTIYGEGTPESFWKGIDEGHISEGLIPRFTILEYHGIRVPRNRNAFHAPCEELTKKFSDLCSIAISTNTNGTCCPVDMELDAVELLDAFDLHADNQINKRSESVEIQLWNRAHLKALKMSALLAVGENAHQPLVTSVHAEWAINLVHKEIESVSWHFNVGQDNSQEGDLIRICKEWADYDSEKRIKSYKCPKQIADFEVIPFVYITTRLRRMSSFKNDRRGFKRAMEEALDLAVQSGELEKLAPTQVTEQFNSRMALYTLPTS